MKYDSGAAQTQMRVYKKVGGVFVLMNTPLNLGALTTVYPYFRLGRPGTTIKFNTIDTATAVPTP